MDQSKLLKALERTKAERDQKSGLERSSNLYRPNERIQSELESVGSEPETQTKSTKAKTRPVQGQLVTDLLPLDTLMARTGALEKMSNPNPMSVNDMKKNKLVYAGMKKRSVLNAYRELRIKLKDESDADNIVVLMTSVDAAENSIITSMNLAISFALDMNASALLVDCNPYGTELQKLVTSPLGDGITDYIMAADKDLEKIIYPSGIDRVNVIPAGSSSASAVELFSSPAMKDLLYELKNRYSDRFIVINAPPVQTSSEARVLSKYCDHSVLTVPYGRTNMDAIEDAVASLGAANVSGVVYQQ